MDSFDRPPRPELDVYRLATRRRPSAARSDAAAFVHERLMRRGQSTNAMMRSEMINPKIETAPRSAQVAGSSSNVVSEQKPKQIRHALDPGVDHTRPGYDFLFPLLLSRTPSPGHLRTVVDASDSKFIRSASTLCARTELPDDGKSPLSLLFLSREPTPLFTSSALKRPLMNEHSEFPTLTRVSALSRRKQRVCPPKALQLNLERCATPSDLRLMTLRIVESHPSPYASR